MEQAEKNKSCVLIIGIGNTYRSDDALGLYVAQDIKRGAPDHVNVIEQSGDGAALMESWENADSVILIDAVYSGARPATIHRFDVHTQPIPARFFHYSTHAFGIAEAIELARALNRLPPHMIVYGIEGKCFEAGIGLSPEVEKAVQEVVTRVRHDIQNVLSRRQTEPVNNPLSKTP